MSSGAQIIKENCSLFNGDRPLETFRQWVVVLGSCIIVPLLVAAILKIKGFSRKFTLDQLVLGCEAVKVSVSLTDQLLAGALPDRYLFLLHYGWLPSHCGSAVLGPRSDLRSFSRTHFPHCWPQPHRGSGFQYCVYRHCHIVFTN